MPTQEEWSRAFAKQARADFDTWNALQLKMPEGSPPVPRSHKAGPERIDGAMQQLGERALLDNRSVPRMTAGVTAGRQAALYRPAR